MLYHTPEYICNMAYRVFSFNEIKCPKDTLPGISSRSMNPSPGDKPEGRFPTR